MITAEQAREIVESRKKDISILREMCFSRIKERAEGGSLMTLVAFNPRDYCEERVGDLLKELEGLGFICKIDQTLDNFIDIAWG